MSMMLINPFLLFGQGTTPYTGWTPSNGTAPYAWYNADDPGATRDGGNNLTYLPDLSGNARHMTTGEIANVTLIDNGISTRKAINCDTGGDMAAPHRLRIPSATGFLNNKSGFSAAFVAYRVGSSGVLEQTFFLCETNARNTSRAMVAVEGTVDNTPRVVARRADADSAAIQGHANTIGDPSYVIFAVSWDFSSRTLRFRVNGVETTNAAFTSVGASSSATNSFSNPMFFSQNPAAGTATRSFKGSAGEMLVYDTALAQAELEKMEGYLAWTWNQLAVLPGGHPYKNSQPPP